MNEKPLIEMTTPPYVPVPVQAAKEVAQRYSKHQVVIIAFDAVHDKIHTCTYGAGAEEKIEAASKISDMDSAKFTEDFRKEFDAAKYKQAIELLRSAECVMSAHAVGHKTQRAINLFLKG